jgi:hypothetical protein
VSKKKEEVKTEAAQSATPKVEFSATSHDFGKVPEGETVRHAFKVTNKGGATLKIENVRSSCGCAVATPKEKELASGASTEIEVTFNSRGRPGKNRKVITVTTNDPDNANARLEIKADVEPKLAFDARHVRLNPAYGEEQVKEVRLTGELAKGAQLKVEEVSEDGPDVEVLAAEGDKPAGLRLKLKGKKVGTGAGRVLVSTNVEDPKQISLRYSWQVSGNIRVVPTRPYFDPARPGLKERVLTVTSSRPEFKLVSARITQGPFKAAVEKPETGKGFAVRVTLTAQGDAATKPGADQGTLVLLSNDPIEPKKEVPLRVASHRGGRHMGRRGGPRGVRGPGPGGPGRPPPGLPVRPPAPRATPATPPPAAPATPPPAAPATPPPAK